MSAFHNTALMGASGQGGYFINNSLRFRSGASPYFTRTASVAGNRQKFTLSMWVKIGKTGVTAYRAGLFGSGNCATGGGSGLGVHIQGNNESSAIQAFVGGGTTMLLITNQKFRDPSAWYHLVFSIDTTQATAANRFRMYVNNQEITSFSTNTQISQNYSFDWNNLSSAIYLGAYNDGTPISTFFDGYMAEVYHVDGQQLTPSSFGQNDTLTGQWVPKAYLSTYGTNGFYLKFADTSGVTAATIGKDSSGNGNNLTPSGISNTAGVTYDFMTDSPTVGPLASNYAVLNPGIRQWNSSDFVSDGNLKYTVGNGSGVTGTVAATIPIVSGKWYAEFYINAAVTAQWIGVSSNLARIGLGSVDCGIRNPGYAYKVNTGNKCNNDNTGTAYGASSTTGDIIGVAMDADTGSITFYKNGTSLGVAYTGMTNAGNGWVFGCDSDPSGSFFVNFGQRPFSYTPPTGYSALNTYNLSAPAIKNGAAHIAATLYTGNGTTQSVVNTVNGTSFQPDLVWMKIRSTTGQHVLTDSVRGISKQVFSSSQNIETAESTKGVTAFNSNGFTLGGDLVTIGSTNNNTYTYVAWQFKGGGTAVTNTNGTISSQVSANPTAGFSAVTYTGTGANATVGHGLGVAPSMVIIKNRVDAGRDWQVYHVGLTSAANSIQLNSNAAQGSNPTQFNSTAPTSSVFSVGSAAATNGSTNTFIAYCFAAVAGYSAFGVYVGNGAADGPFVYTGFRPKFVLTKATGTANGTTSSTVWTIWDTTRNSTNPTVFELYPAVITAEGTDSNGIDIMSNGFKPTRNSEYHNWSGTTYIYIAFAENPFKYSNAR
jgi:hypothetical protein